MTMTRQQMYGREFKILEGGRLTGVCEGTIAAGGAVDDDLVDAILRFADLRKRRSQLASGGGLPAHLGIHA